MTGPKLLFLALAVTLTSCTQSIEKQVDILYEKMNWEERYAQLKGLYMTQFFDENLQLDTALCREKIPNGVGHISQYAFNTFQDPDDVRDMVCQLQTWLVENTPSGIPALFHEELLTGVNTRGATIYPQQIGLACSFNPELAEQYSTRIVRLLDGVVVGDSDPYEGEPVVSVEESKQALKQQKKAEKKGSDAPVEEMSKAETSERILCLVFVYAVVIFFWMAFHQNGLTLTWFADEFTATSSTGLQSMLFDVTNLVACIFIVYGIFGIFQSKTTKARTIYGTLMVLAIAFLGYKYANIADVTELSAPIFQQFNACFVVMLTPVSIALFGWLAKKGKEPKAPFKIGLGMLVAAGAYLLMTMSSIGLPATDHPNHVADVTPNLLVTTYLILTFAELLLSPIGISFVTKVAPAKYKGMMMGGWFVATALGNKLVSIPGHMWDMPLPVVWGTLMGICLLAAAFIFAIIKRLNKVA